MTFLLKIPSPLHSLAISSLGNPHKLMAAIVFSIDLAGDFLLAICSLLVDTASTILRAVWQTLLSVVSKAMVIAKPLGGWLDPIEASGDLAVGVAALIRYLVI